jgi:hypothetical protein
LKILITGYTSRQCASPRVVGDYMTFSSILPIILRDMGHEVERRVVKVSETISGIYNYVFAGLAPLGSITSAKVAETHYAMDAMPGRHCVFVDDWSFCGFNTSAKSTLKRWDAWVKYKNFPFDTNVIATTKESIERILQFSNPGNNAPVLAPMFPWGDHEWMMRGNYAANLHTIDPSAWVKYPTVDILSCGSRKRQWVNAALSDHSPWIKRQGFKDPILHLGNKRMGDGEFVYENFVVRAFAESTGVISVGYPSAGSGWWRTRNLNAAWAETPLYCDIKDQKTMGLSYQVTAQKFENEICTPLWDDRAKGQVAWLEENISKKEEVMTKLEEILNA